MAELQSMTIPESTVRTLIVQLRAYHAKTAPSGQNEGSNDTDDMHDDLEMTRGSADIADLEGTYAELGADERTDLAALVLLGMDEAQSLADGRKTAADRGGPGMAEFLEMPLSAQYLASGLEAAGYPSGGHDPSREPGGDSHAA